MSCLICDRIKMIQAGINPYFVYELETGYVVIGDHQYFLGYTCFLFKEHITELHFIDKKVRLKHLEEMSIVYEAVFNAFRPDKMNAELLGNGDAHVHWHLFPRYSDDPFRKGPVWWVQRNVMFSEDNKPDTIELEKLKDRLRTEILKLI